MTWVEFVLAFLVFFASHSILIRAPAKPWIVACIGSKGFVALYASLSLAVLAWLITSAARAPYVELWSWSSWQSYMTLALMLPACLLLAMSIARPNPFSFGGVANDRFDPAHPGIIRWTRHPLLAVLTLWSIAHVVPNGNLAHVLVFGSFTAFALFGHRLVDRRKRLELGAEWQRMLMRVQASGTIPKPLSYRSLICRLALGIGLFLALIWLHPLVLGVSPIQMRS